MSGTIGKRRAIMAGALSTFARDGYTRASMDAIAAASGVSTRTLYNHFADKEALFAAVITESAAQVAEAQVELADRALEGVTDPGDLVAALTEFGTAWAIPGPRFADHFALVRQIRADLPHIPAETVAAWQRTGPQRVTRAVTHHLRRLADRGLLHVPDPDRAALHLAALITATHPAPSDAERVTAVHAGVAAFLRGHLP